MVYVAVPRNCPQKYRLASHKELVLRIISQIATRNNAPGREGSLFRSAHTKSHDFIMSIVGFSCSGTASLHSLDSKQKSIILKWSDEREMDSLGFCGQNKQCEKGEREVRMFQAAGEQDCVSLSFHRCDIGGKPAVASPPKHNVP